MILIRSLADTRRGAGFAGTGAGFAGAVAASGSPTSDSASAEDAPPPPTTAATSAAAPGSGGPSGVAEASIWEARSVPEAAGPVVASSTAPREERPSPIATKKPMPATPTTAAAPAAKSPTPRLRVGAVVAACDLA
jgi:hypothetical protein